MINYYMQIRLKQFLFANFAFFESLEFCFSCNFPTILFLICSDNFVYFPLIEQSRYVLKPSLTAKYYTIDDQCTYTDYSYLYD